jgi:ankyrin repeat protein
MNKRFSLNDFSNKEITEETYIQFHKLIADDDEEGAIKLLKECGDSFNVNYEYKSRVPLFSAINNRMYDLYDEIVNHPTFDCGIEDGFGETLLESLLYISGSDEITFLSENDRNSINRMIKIVLNSKKFDFNATDLNNDTAINVACEYPRMIFVVEELAKKEEVNPNIINDFGCTALTNAIRHKNIEAVKILSKRNDILVRTVDLEEANKVGIDLADFGFKAAIKLKKAHEYAMA